MRLVQLYVPHGERDSIVATLDAEGVDFGITEETGDGNFEAIASIPVAPKAVDPLLSRLRSAGLHRDSYVVVLAAETIVAGREADPADRFEGARISRDELRARAEELAPALSTFLALLVLSTVIATAGLLTNSAATIIGAMVVAPLMGPALAASVGVVVDDQALASRGVVLQGLGLVAAVATAALVGWLLRGTVLLPPGFDVTGVPEVRERITPTVLSLFLALGSGAAAVVSLTRNVGSVLVGVAIAVALVPPAATAGLGIAWGHPTVILTAGTLVLVNLLAINLTALLLLWFSGYRPHGPTDLGRTVRTVLSRTVVILVAISLLTVVLAGVSYGTYQVSAVEHDVDEELAAMSEDGAFDELRFHEVEVAYELHDVYADRDPAVTVLVERPPGEEVPSDFADAVRERLEAATGTELSVAVELVDTQRSG
ncbi:TIGR00341 family protein [Halovivax sp.]|uniref:TIGR00341 family protein n=1 Tax=Halovivax sp. TaxID=1935978 RepID=UPI0025C04683|nr:TIGR00341 family protein [Halovivax sp.]